MDQQEIVNACAALWEHITGHEQPHYAIQQERKPDGTYMNGYRNDIEMWQLHDGERKLTAKHVRWQKFALGQDSEGTRRILTINHGDKEVFMAIEDGSSVQTNFTEPNEQYMATVHTEAVPWRIVMGLLSDVRF